MSGPHHFLPRPAAHARRRLAVAVGAVVTAAGALLLLWSVIQGPRACGAWVRQVVRVEDGGDDQRQ